MTGGRGEVQVPPQEVSKELAGFSGCGKYRRSRKGCLVLEPQRRYHLDDILAYIRHNFDDALKCQLPIWRESYSKYYAWPFCKNSIEQIEKWTAIPAEPTPMTDRTSI